MAKTVTKGKIGLEDIEVGTSTFTRTKSDGVNQTLTQLDLEDVPGSSLTLIDRASAPSSPSANRAVFYTLTSDDVARFKTDAGTVVALADDTNAQTLAGIKTFSSIPVLPASNPTTDNQAARKAYVDTFAAKAGATFTGTVSVSSGGLYDSGSRTVTGYTIINSDAAVTATTAETDLKSTTIAANTLGSTGGIRVYAAGTVTGSAGTKRIRLYFGATAIADTTAVSGTGDWYIEALIFNTATNAQRVLAKWSDPVNATNHNKDYITAAIDTTASVVLKITGTLGSSADTITQTMWVQELILV